MRKNIFRFFALAMLGSLMLTGCTKKAVVTPKQTNQSNFSSKTGGTTGSTTTTTAANPGSTHTCGGGSSHPGG
jgi:hypothetical protein